MPGLLERILSPARLDLDFSRLAAGAQDDLPPPAMQAEITRLQTALRKHRTVPGGQQFARAPHADCNRQVGVWDEAALLIQRNDLDVA